MKKQMILMAYCLSFTFLGCANNSININKERKVTKNGGSIITVSDNALPYTHLVESLKRVSIDTGEYKIEYVLYQDILRENPDYARNWHKIEGLNPHQIHSIKFIEKRTNQVLKTYDVAKESPFANLPYIVKGRENDAGFIYAFQSESRLNPPLNFKKKYLDYVEDYKVTEVRTSYSVDDEIKHKKEHTVIAYRAEYFNDRLQLIGANAILRVLNNKGEIVGDIDNISTQAYLPVVTNNGKYVAFMRGGHLNEELEQLDNHGIEIFSVQEKQRVFQIDEKENTNMSSPGTTHNFLGFEVDNYKEQNTEMHFVSPVEKVDYIKIVSKTQRNQLKVIDQLGITFFDKERGITTYFRYDKDFQIKKIEEK
jgi:hypothetical protein